MNTRKFPINYFVLTGLFLCVFLAEPSFSDGLKEYQIKSVLSANFSKFARWSDNKVDYQQGNFVFCVLGDFSVTKAFDKIEGKKIGGRPISVLKFNSISSKLQQCQAMFVARLDRKKLPRLFEVVKSHSVLMIGEMNGFLEYGGMINFVKRKGRIKFEINLVSVEEKGIKLSSRLLKLAVIIKK